jgi:hypothetical protein
MGRYWSPGPNAAEFRWPIISWGMVAFSLGVYFLAVVGIGAMKQRGLVLVVSLAPVFYFMVLHAVFVSSIRYRIPAMPLFELASGIGIAALIERWFRR